MEQEIQSYRRFIEEHQDIPAIERQDAWLELKGAKTKFGITEKYNYYRSVIAAYEKKYKLPTAQRQQKMQELAQHFKRAFCG